MKHNVTFCLGVLLALSALLVLSGCSTPLRKAAAKGDMAEVERLLAQGADINEEGHDGGWPLPLGEAASVGNLEMMEFLLDKGADVNAKNSFGSTALMYAARACQPEAVRLLLERGADLEVRNRSDESAADEARKAANNPNLAEPCGKVIALLEGAAMKKAMDAAREEKRQKAEEEAEHIRAALEGADLLGLLAMSPENGQWAEALAKALIAAKNTELPVFLARATVTERVALLTTVELRITDAQTLTAAFNARAEDAVRNGQSAAPLRVQAGKVQVYSGVLSAIRGMLLGS